MTVQTTAAACAAPITVMNRVEMKYILNKAQVERLKAGLKGHMEVDRYGKTSISSLYYDTPDQLLIRTSTEAEDYKEKIRLRAYGPATVDTPVYLELKRKACGVVYKRRIQTTIPDVQKFLGGADALGQSGQIHRELAQFRNYYDALVPACLIIYDRTAWYEPGGDLRLTIDENPRYRTEALDLTRAAEGTPLLPDGGAILEIKVQDAMPLWLTHLLSENRIYKSTFSKYGRAFCEQQLSKKD